MNHFDLLLKKNPLLAFQLQQWDPSPVQFCYTQKEERNLTRQYEGESFFYHSQLGALDEARDWFAKLDLEGCNALFVYGIGLGYYFLAAKKWLKQDLSRRLIFLEEDKSVLYRLFETEIGSEVLNHTQVQIVAFENLFEDKAVFNELAWTHLYANIAISALKLYADVNPQGCLDINRHLSYLLVERKAFVDEYLKFGVPFFKNFYPNLLELPKAYLGNALFGQFKNVPAIISGAGPSLGKNRHLLKGIQNKALLFAGSSGLNALLSEGIIPHFGVAIDPNPSQVPRVQSAAPFQIPFFYRGRLNHAALQSLTGPRLYLTGTGGYAISKFFEEELNIEGEELDEGQNVVNFCMEIAQALGCNPIILVGADLAYTDKQYYAQGVAESLNLTEKDFERSDDFEAKLVEREDIHGKPISTLWKWIAEAEWISEFAKEHPSIQLMNATEGGLGMKDVPNVTLEQALGPLQELPTLQKRIQTNIQAHPLHAIQPSTIENILQKLKASLNRSIELIAKLRNESKKLLECIACGVNYPPTLQTTEMALLEHEIEEEVAYPALLDTFNQIFMRLHFGKIQELQQSDLSHASDKEKIELQLDRLNFLQEAARVNLAIMNGVFS